MRCLNKVIFKLNESIKNVMDLKKLRCIGVDGVAARLNAASVLTAFFGTFVNQMDSKSEKFMAQQLFFTILLITYLGSPCQRCKLR